MLKVRPVAAVRTGSKSAISMKTSVVSMVHPVVSPPMTPARLITPLSSPMAVISSSSAYSLPLSAAKRAPPRPRLSQISPSTLPASKTCTGRLRSIVRKLVRSTSAEIGRRPTEASRSLSQRGLSQLRNPRT